MDTRDCTHLDDVRQEKNFKEQIEYHKQGLRYHTQALKALTDDKPVDKVKLLCKQVSISKKVLAQAILFDCEGDITQKELAKTLNVSRMTIWKWPDIRRAFIAMKSKI